MAVAGVGAAVALGADSSVQRSNLDRDRALEEIQVEEVGNGPTSERVRILDTCPKDREVNVVVSDLEDRVVQFKIERADTRRGKEVFFHLATGRGARGDMRLVAWRAFESPPCRRPRYLFSYARDARPAPAGAEDLVSHRALLAEQTARHPGKELWLRETFQDESDPICCPSIERETYYRYDRERDKYRPYRTKVEDSEE